MEMLAGYKAGGLPIRPIFLAQVRNTPVLPILSLWSENRRFSWGSVHCDIDKKHLHLDHWEPMTRRHDFRVYFMLYSKFLLKVGVGPIAQLAMDTIATIPRSEPLTLEEKNTLLSSKIVDMVKDFLPPGDADPASWAPMMTPPKTPKRDELRDLDDVLNDVDVDSDDDDEIIGLFHPVSEVASVALSSADVTAVCALNPPIRLNMLIDF
jgi:hypothetical protein